MPISGRDIRSAGDRREAFDDLIFSAGIRAVENVLPEKWNTIRSAKSVEMVSFVVCLCQVLHVRGTGYCIVQMRESFGQESRQCLSESRDSGSHKIEVAKEF